MVTNKIQLKMNEVTTQQTHLYASLGAITFYESYAQFNSETNMIEYINKSFFYNQLQSDIEANVGSYFIFWENETPIGYAKVNYTIYPDCAPTLVGNIAEIQRIYLLKSAQKKGIGGVAFNEIINYLITKKIDYLWLGVWKNNANAIEFYHKMNMKIIGERIFELGTQVYDDYIFGLSISQS